jgi:hypothetical protein
MKDQYLTVKSRISGNRSETTTTKSQLDSFESSSLSIFEENIRVYKIKQQAGRIRVDTARNKLKRDIGAYKDMKMELHADMVGD